MFGLTVGYLAIVAITTAVSLGLIYRLRRRWDSPKLALKATTRPARRTPIWTGLAALGIGLGAQYALARDLPLWGAMGYLVALLLFITAMRPFLALDVQDEAMMHVDAGPPDVLPLPAGQTLTLRERIGLFRTHWRLFALADVLAGFRRPDLPALPPAESPSLVAPPLKPAALTTWRANEAFRPQALIVTPGGELLALDVEQSVVYRFNTLGRLLERWSVPELPPLNSFSLAVSPAGDTLYIADAANRCVRVLGLVAA